MLMAIASGADLASSTRRRLEILVELNGLGSGFQISSIDLDIRGAGQLLGEAQAGHLQVIGLALYRQLLGRALETIQDHDTNRNRRAEVDLGIRFGIPSDYVPQPESRIELAAALDGVHDERALEDLHEEFVDRFGPMPPKLRRGFELAMLRLRATLLGVEKLDGGPKAIAATLSSNAAARLKLRLKPKQGESLRWSKGRLILKKETAQADERLTAAEELLEQIS